jgi:hypothetical protein
MDALEYAKAQTRHLRKEQALIRSIERLKSTINLATAGCHNFSLISNEYTISESSLNWAIKQVQKPNGDIDMTDFAKHLSIAFVATLQLSIDKNTEELENLPSLEEI